MDGWMDLTIDDAWNFTSHTLSLIRTAHIWVGIKRRSELKTKHEKEEMQLHSTPSCHLPDTSHVQ